MVLLLLLLLLTLCGAGIVPHTLSLNIDNYWTRITAWRTGRVDTSVLVRLANRGLVVGLLLNILKVFAVATDLRWVVINRTSRPNCRKSSVQFL